MLSPPKPFFSWLCFISPDLVGQASDTQVNSEISMVDIYVV